MEVLEDFFDAEAVRTFLGPDDELGRTDRIALDRLGVMVIFADDGAGIQQSAPIGYGLSGMRERVRLLHGSLSIEPNAPRGTIVSVAIPLTDKEKAKSDGRVLSNR